MSLERCTECQRIVDTDMEEGKYINNCPEAIFVEDVDIEFYCDSCVKKLEPEDD